MPWESGGAKELPKLFAANGANQQDAAHAQGGVQNQKNSDSLNDVGWNIFSGNYERYLTQYNPNGTSVGWWRVGDTSQPYGRFARGFDHANGKDIMYFNINDTLFSQFPLNGTETVTLHIVYYDTGRGTWQIKYDAKNVSGIDNSQKVLDSFTNTNTGKWVHYYKVITDAKFGNRCPNGTDLMLVNTDNRNEIFHLIEIIKQP